MNRIAITFAMLLGLSNCLRAEDMSFRRQIAPLLLTHCVGCHDEQTSEGDYQLHSFAALVRPGDSGELPIAKEQGGPSELLRRLTTDDEEARMPAESEALPAASIQLIRDWIQQGAKYDAEDRNAPLASILPVTQHPAAPERYRVTMPVTAIAFHDGDLLVGGYHEILRWDLTELDQPSLVQRVPQVGQRIYSLEVDDAKNRLYVGSGTPGRLGEVRVLNLESGQLLGVPVVTDEVVLDIDLHPTRPLLCVAGADRKIRIVDLEAGQVSVTFDSHSDWVNAVAWNRDGSELASASRDKTAKVFDLATHRIVATYAGHAENVTDVCFASDSSEDRSKTELISCDAAGRIKRWKAKDGMATKVKFPRQGKAAFGLLPSSAGLWVASDQHQVSQLDWNGKKTLRQLSGQAEGCLALAFDPNGKRIATSDSTGTVRIWDSQTGKLLSQFVSLPVK